MKTAKFFSILSFTLLFNAVNAFSATDKLAEKDQMTTKMNIRYEVNVYLFTRIDLCNTYWVQIMDENGRLVAPPQIFVPGLNQYTFYSMNKEEAYRERGTKRIAMLVLSPLLRNLECENNLFTRPDVKTGLFGLGQTYSFDLFPSWVLQTDKN